MQVESLWRFFLSKEGSLSAVSETRYKGPIRSPLWNARTIAIAPVLPITIHLFPAMDSRDESIKSKDVEAATAPEPILSYHEAVPVTIDPAAAGVAKIDALCEPHSRTDDQEY